MRQDRKRSPLGLLPVSPPSMLAPYLSQRNSQTTLEVVQRSTLSPAAATSPAPSEAGVFVGIQQMEYGGLAAPHLLSLGPFSGGWPDDMEGSGAKVWVG